MKRRALVLGSQILGLTGVHNDVEAMKMILGRYGFAVDRRIGSDASRDGILDGYRRLIADSRADDAAVVYYSGHGAFAVNPTRRPNQPKHLQCIVPTDWGAGGGFRGILHVELSALMAELTARTKNVTVILDCCHAAQMSRAAEPSALTPRALPRAWADGVDEFLAQHSLDLSQVHVESNPDAVRLAATQADRSAYEALLPRNGELIRMGLLTRALQLALEECGDAPLAWRTLALRVRELVMNQAMEQRPEVEGPADRLLFSTVLAPRSDAVVFFYDDGRPSLRAGRLLGARPGAVFDVLPLGATDLEAGSAAEATVVEIMGNVSRVALHVASQAQPPQAGTLAIPRTLPFPCARVSVRGDAKSIAPLLQTLQTSRFLELVADGPNDFEVVVENQRLTLFDDNKGQIAHSEPNDAGGRQNTRARLERWAKALALRDLQAGGLPPTVAAVRWGRVVNGKPVPLSAGETLHVGDFVYVTIENKTDVDLYAAIFDIGVRGAVTLLTAATPTGRKIAPGAGYTLGERFGVLEGLGPLTWPEEVPTTEARRESILVILAEDWNDFQSFETPRDSTRGHRTPLEALLASMRQGTTREIPASRPDGGRYDVRVFDFNLSPTPRAQGASLNASTVEAA
ncbi:caspase family protein [Caldilinea sp.]|uniref:caspase family protein n=1 Tax=Caldilinea sp. TaxID=2293560 RepID=UPI002621C403|nr:caspase family protein [uncultured Caldilinea sp.]